ncbi:sigma 54-interacting transcriptional regulator [Halobacillus shinanisalinarum]|uniref:Sigma 54-interacting transcriptional regulator n=1 Tax=Halobacillus shinanisalinarum TaxID=2932258 RepID=A0ABY4H406_9BACI|nr:sigma-54-dependent Fis family transcriptional regulator [Halobacillus shinanisalinarum]UOQ94640.1 sigma 54-interacting transcriptional regulator [Halobacillus shinanisalinarum]
MIQDFVQSSEHELEKEELLKVERWMIPDHCSIPKDKSLREAAEMIEHLNVECLPVVDGNKHPIGMVTLPILLNRFIYGHAEESVADCCTKKNHSVVHSNVSLLEISAMTSAHFSIVDEQERLIGVLSRKEILKGFSLYIRELNQMEHTAEILNGILESAYEGVAVVDEDGILREFNEAYSRFTGIAAKDAIGRHVNEVIDNTRLPYTVQTGMPERGVVQYIQGQAMIVHRIPIWKNEKVVGAIGMLIFEGVTEVYRIYEKLQENSLHKQPKPFPSQAKLKESRSMTLDQIIGNSESTAHIKRLARKVAKSEATVLITGESGTGKEMYAKGIHHLSPFSSGPFISLNCGAIPEHLFESELFGYEEGAFTGAKKGGKLGKFELAQHGTLFLDEIGEMPLMMQTKLLRVLQEKEVERVGGNQPYEIETRIIAATNRNLKDMIEAGEFREDLYYRINVIEIPLSPLRERTEDIPQLVSYYLHAICNKYQMSVKVFTSEAMAVFLHYHWPGNIRELMNTLEKLAVLVDGNTINSHHLPDYMIDKETFRKEESNEITTLMKQAKSLENEKEREIIRTVLRKTGGNKSKAAKQLGIHRTTLYQKLKKYDLNEL